MNKELKERIENLSYTAYAELHRKKESPSYGKDKTSQVDHVDAKKVIRILVERIVNILPVTEPKELTAKEEELYQDVIYVRGKQQTP